MKTTTNTSETRGATTRVGLIGGLVLGLAMFAQQIASDYDGQSLGLMIVVIGFSVIGYYAAKFSNAKERFVCARIGGLASLIAGLLVALAFVGATIYLSFDVERNQRVQEQSLQAMSEIFPNYASVLKTEIQRDPEGFKAQYQLSQVIATTCCGVIIPLMGLILGALGGATATNHADTTRKK